MCENEKLVCTVSESECKSLKLIIGREYALNELMLALNSEFVEDKDLLQKKIDDDFSKVKERRKKWWSDIVEIYKIPQMYQSHLALQIDNRSVYYKAPKSCC